MAGTRRKERLAVFLVNLLESLNFNPFYFFTDRLVMEAIDAMYQNGAYLENNPSWHVEDSPWKATQIRSILERTGLKPKTVCEIGCGAGEILNQLHLHLGSEVSFVGYELSEAAYRMSLSRQKPGISFVHGDLFENPDTTPFDLLLAIDVFEHVEDYYGFLRKCREKATRTVFNIPLDLSVQTVFRPGALLEERRRVGHLHYFTKETALASLTHAGFQIEDSALLCMHMEKSYRQVGKKLLNGSRQILSRYSRDLTARLLGGFSLLVVAK